jgi:peptidoglycan-associated lipoprotein
MHKRNIMTFPAIVLLVGAAACAPRQPRVATTPQPPPPVETARENTPPPPPPKPIPPPPVARVDEAQPVVRPTEDLLAAKSLDDLNRDSLLKPAFFPVDAYELDDAGRAVVSANADVLKQYPTWMITIEGHADERGTPEYNLALGERRAIAAKNYLVSLGVSPDRVRTISYGKEFPFDPGHDEAAWAKNRRAHFVITAK